MYVCTNYLSVLTYWLHILHRNSPLNALYITEPFTGSCSEIFFIATIERTPRTVSIVQIAKSSRVLATVLFIAKQRRPISL